MATDFCEDLIKDKVVGQYDKDIKSLHWYLHYLRKEYGFGDPRLMDESMSSQIQAVFDISIRPLLQHAVDTLDVNLYSELDHYLFRSYICPFEDAQWFEKSFWHVNHYGSVLADRIKDRLYKADPGLRLPNCGDKVVLIVFKGPFKLAHSEVLSDFLTGLSGTSAHSSVVLLLIDSPIPDNLPPNIASISLANLGSSHDKLTYYCRFTASNIFCNIVWVACVQNLMLYLGIRASSTQTYWTMKRHSIVHPKIDRYATVVSSYRNEEYNGVLWFGGRYRLRTQVSALSQDGIRRSLSQSAQNLMSRSSLCLGSFARPQKYQNKEYWLGIRKLLRDNPDCCFLYGTTELPGEIERLINNDEVLASRSHNFGWLDGRTEDHCKLVDIYLDNIPFASGMTASQCVWNNGVYLGTLSEINKESSFINILFDAYEFTFGRKCPIHPKALSQIGVSSSFSETLVNAQLLIKDPVRRFKVRTNQLMLLKSMHAIGEKYFASDYYKYFTS